MSGDTCMLKIEHIGKTFGPTVANKDISLEFYPGEVRGLAGENGSGKSTLMSIIAGIQRHDTGTMFKDGVEYRPVSPVDANGKKIGIVVQELGLVNSLPVGINIFLGRTGRFSRCGVINLGKLYAEAERELKKWKLDHIPVRQIVDGLSVEDKKLIELARALSVDPDILILDEVSAALSHDKRMLLYDVIGDFRKRGKTVIMIAHDLDEILRLSDTITVLKDGEVVATEKAADLSLDRLKRMMVGREINEDYYRRDAAPATGAVPALEVSGLSVDDAFSDISFSLAKGEILGVCGLSDAGIHELGKALFGILAPKNGSVVACRSGASISGPAVAMKNGIAYVPKDRDTDALMIEGSIEANICLPSFDELQGPLGFINPNKMHEVSRRSIDDYSIKTTGFDQRVGRLSGGNKQKVNLARWMLRDIDVLVLDCPTRGVDIGVKAYIYAMINDSRKKGLAILLISDELPEVIGMSDRILVLKNGASAGIFERGAGFTEEKIIEVMI